jgi:chromosome segregation ATPase
MITAAEAKQLGGVARQVRALLLGIDKLPEAFDEVEGLEVRLATAKRELRDVDAQMTASKLAAAKLDSDYRDLQVRYGQLDAEYRDKQAQLEASLSTLLAEVAAAQDLKRETEQQLAAISAKLTA